MKPLIKHFAAACLVLGLTSPALAHTPLKTSTPSSGSILTESPDAITLDFGDPVVLTYAAKSQGVTDPVKLEYAPKGRSATYTISAPDLPAGRNEIHWKALSPDGHVLDGTIILVIKP